MFKWAVRPPVTATTGKSWRALLAVITGPGNCRLVAWLPANTALRKPTGYHREFTTGEYSVDSRPGKAIRRDVRIGDIQIRGRPNSRGGNDEQQNTHEGRKEQHWPRRCNLVRKTPGGGAKQHCLGFGRGRERVGRKKLGLTKSIEIETHTYIRRIPSTCASGLSNIRRVKNHHIRP